MKASCKLFLPMCIIKFMSHTNSISQFAKINSSIGFCALIVKFKFEEFSPERLREMREKRNLTREQLAQASGIPEPTLIKWELGLRTPNLEGLSKLGEYFGVYFFAGWQKAPDSQENQGL